MRSGDPSQRGASQSPQTRHAPGSFCDGSSTSTVCHILWRVITHRSGHILRGRRLSGFNPAPRLSHGSLISA